MAYNNYYPMNYQPNYYGQLNPYQPQYQPQMIQQPQQQTQPVQRIAQPSIQQSGFVLVQSEQEARAYPVAPGNSITFKDERQPYCYVKTMGFNQLDRPTFERYRLVKEEIPSEAPGAPASDFNAQEGKDIAYALKSDVAALWGELDALKEAMKTQMEKKTIKTRKAEPEKEIADDE